MREILFRGKRLDNGEWVYGLPVDILKECARLRMVVNGFVKYITVKSSTIGQYTGLTDKNGKKIFEGDIVKNPINDGIFVVKYKNSLACFLGISIHGNPSTGLYSGFEVIGNIYDNPELLERSKT